MLPLFITLASTNTLLLCVVFGLGLFVTDAQGVITQAYPVHLILGILAGLFVALTHVSVYMYFMATARWLQAATDKANLDVSRFAEPALSAKSKIFPLIMAPIVVTMLAMFAGAGADPTLHRLWPAEVHLLVGLLALVVNLGSHVVEFTRIKTQGALMDEALAILNHTPGVTVETV